MTEAASQLSVAERGTSAAAAEDIMTKPMSAPGSASEAAIPAAEPEQRMSFYEGTIISVRRLSAQSNPVG